MAESKIRIRIGSIEFEGEGDPKWLSSELDKIIEKAPSLVKLAPSPAASAPPGGHTPMEADSEVAAKSLAAFLREKSASDNQTKKFLVTAVWLESKGQNRLKTGDVTGALRSNNQSRLGNASQCLASNVQQGYCERDGDKFFVTTEGKASL